MKYLSIFVLLCVGLASCSNEEEPELHPVPYENCDSGWCSYSIFNSSTLDERETDLGSYVTVEPGQNSVFRMQYVKDDEENIADDELIENLYFELNLSEGRSFDITTDQVNSYFGRICFCGGAPYYKPANGTFKGEMINDTQWQVEVDINVNFPGWNSRHIAFTAIFTPED